LWTRLWKGTLEHEHEQCTDTSAEAVHGERRQGVRLEVTHQELDRGPGGGACAERTDERLAANAVAVLAYEIGKLEEGGRTDDRRRE